MTEVSRDVPPLWERYTRQHGRIHLTGLQALVRISLDQLRRDREQGLRVGAFYSGYPGSPLAGLDQTLSRLSELLDAQDVRLVPGLNEEIAAGAVCGTQMLDRFPHSQYDGVLGLWFGKAPGLDRAIDVIRHSNHIGISRYGGALALVADDPMCKSSSLPSHSETALAHAYVPTLVPSDAREVLELGRFAFALSRYTGLWTALKIVPDVADGGTLFELDEQEPALVLPEFEIDGRPFAKRLETWLLAPRVNQVEEEILYHRLEAARRFARANGINRILSTHPTDRIGFVACGRLYRELLSAFERLGLDARERARLGIRCMQLRMLYPLDELHVDEFAKGLEEVVVVDERRGFLETQLRAALCNSRSRPRVCGQFDETGRPWLARHVDIRGETLARDLAPYLARRLARPGLVSRADALTRSQSQPVPELRSPRRPHFCSGCPHTRSTAVPAGSLAGGGIGCHTLALLQDESVEFINAMGSEGSQWIGLSHYTDTPHLFQNIGDGTYFHSGRLSLRACVAAGVSITYRILYNGVIAMTGGQTPVGMKSAHDLILELLGEGVSRVVAVSQDEQIFALANRDSRVECIEREDYAASLEALRDQPGVSVVLFDQVCSNQKARMAKRGLIASARDRIVIHQDVCEGCGNCGERSSCASLWPVATPLGRKTRIHDTSCTDDRSCLGGECPAFMSVEAGPRRVPPRLYDPATLPPAPVADIAVDRFEIFTVGIGSTGVVTLNAILLRAAEYEGLSALHLDQTGLAQRGGRVTSHCIFSRAPIEGSARVGHGQAHVCFALDPLSANERDSLLVLSSARTRTLVLEGLAPTVSEVRTPGTVSDSLTDLCSQLEQRSLATFRLRANEVVESALGSPRAANVALLGAAIQLGYLPLSSSSIEATIRDSGISVDENLAAFELGRAVAHDPSLIDELIDAKRAPTVADCGDPAAAREALGEAWCELESAFSESPAGPEHPGWLSQTASFALDLIDYQNLAYAKRYVSRITEILGAETQIKPGSLRLSTIAARELYRVMAYKDEYEVARLLLRGPYRRWLESQYVSRPRIWFHLEPPLLRLFGLKKKVRVGSWIEPVLRVLIEGRRLRGTRWDPFGLLASRRLERRLIVWYDALLAELAQGLTPANLETSIQHANVASDIRGFEQIKQARAQAILRISTATSSS